MSSPGRDAEARARGHEPQKRPRASHSLESVLSEAVAILDESGAQGLTIRALANRLGGGPASVYWYVSGRDELLDLAADSVLAGVLESVADVASGDPIADLRAIARTLFDAIVDRPWLGAYAMRDTGRQVHSLQLYERIGEEVMRLGLGARQSFYAASAVVGFVIGTAADMGQELPDAVLSGELDQKQYLAEATKQWRALDPVEYPFIHHIVDEFAVHDDRDQFRAGLDLLLAGLELQASAR
ncbi:TetR/AcrR family transcriptional regulator C-terminal domain-containing protein [Leifsonia sp. fls2-241-R2A-40a]|uniref:TetR/AcrR family transcriptional regulator n=1 Tax=Leifsonia sp. fls2-241-R2A-40a TaxID=3040290 RepID=UPI00255014E1|nr:TetR/AcrR family transcriptional regulator C-terminal domain-containing protein [Leifsonia sp. fls2-241-R2A-40a]